MYAREKLDRTIRAGLGELVQYVDAQLAEFETVEYLFGDAKQSKKKRKSKLRSSSLKDDDPDSFRDAMRRYLRQYAEALPFQAKRCRTSDLDESAYTDEHVTSFINQFDVLVKPDNDELQAFDNDDTCGFEDLRDEIARQGGNLLEFPSFLVPTLERLEKTYGHVYGPFLPETGDEQAVALYILFCAVIKEMEDVKLEQVNENRLIRWRTVINSVEALGLEGRFVREHIKKIARAFFGLKARDRDWNYQLQQECLREAEYFQGKPLTTGLLP